MPGAIILSVGLVLLVQCAREFHVAGRGTLAPWDPPDSLVVTGPFGVIRNPTYIAVLTVVAGWVMILNSFVLSGYLLLLAIAFHIRVVAWEEPHVQQRFGGAWVAYRSSVPRWIPWRGRKPASSPGGPDTGKDGAAV